VRETNFPCLPNPCMAEQGSSEEPNGNVGNLNANDHPISKFTRRMSGKDWYLVSQGHEVTINNLMQELAETKLENLALLKQMAELEGPSESRGDDVGAPIPPDGVNKGQGSPRHQKVAENSSANESTTNDGGKRKEAEEEEGEIDDVVEDSFDDLPLLSVQRSTSSTSSTSKSIDRRTTQLKHKLPDKVINMTGDQDLMQKNLEHINEADREKLNAKVAQMTGETKVLKKKLRDRFGSQIHKESAEMQAACEKYERLKKESMVGYLHGTAGELKMAIKEKKMAIKDKIKTEGKKVKTKVDELRSNPAVVQNN